MVESPRLAGRDIRTLLCAPQPSRTPPPVEGSTLPETPRKPLPRQRSRGTVRDRLARCLRAAIAGRRCRCIACGNIAAAEPRPRTCAGRRRPPPAAPDEGRSPRPSARPPTWPSLDQIVAPLQDYPLSADDNTKLNAAFKALASADVDQGANDLQASVSDPLARTLIEWERLRRGEGQAADYLKFLSENPDWPSREQLQRRMEETLFEEGGDTDVIATYFTRPRSTQPRRHGRARLGAPRARRKGAREGSRREDLAREGSAGQPREGLPLPLRLDAQRAGSQVASRPAAGRGREAQGQSRGSRRAGQARHPAALRATEQKTAQARLSVFMRPAASTALAGAEGNGSRLGRRVPQGPAAIAAPGKSRRPPSS